MLSLTRKTEYALIAICHLARAGRAKVVSARDIHEQHGAPLPLVMNILKRLNRAGYVASIRGARGGYVLTCRPTELSLRELIEAIEGPVQLVRCKALSKDNPRCALTGKCPIQHAIHRVHYRLRDYLSEVSIADLAFDGCPEPADGSKGPVE